MWRTGLFFVPHLCDRSASFSLHGSLPRRFAYAYSIHIGLECNLAGRAREEDCGERPKHDGVDALGEELECTGMLHRIPSHIM